MFHRRNELGETSPYKVANTVETSKLADHTEAAHPEPAVQQKPRLETVWLKDYDGLIHEVEYGVGYIFPVLAAQMRKGVGTSRDNAIALPYNVKVSMLMPTYDFARVHHHPFAPEEVRNHVFNKIVCLDPTSLRQVNYACEKLGYYSPEKGPARDPQTQRLRELLASRKEKKRLKEEKVQMESEDCPIGYLLSKFSADPEEVDGSSSKSCKFKKKKKKQKRRERRKNASSDTGNEAPKKELGDVDSDVDAVGNNSEKGMDSEFKRKLLLHERPQGEELQKLTHCPP